MAVKLIERKWNHIIGASVDTYLMDTASDVSALPKASTSSRALVPDENKKFIVNTKGEWVADNR